jgi:Ca2+-binding EF-hand superfamily protein
LIAVLDPGMPGETVELGFREIDENSDGIIDYNEFETWWQDR